MADEPNALKKKAAGMPVWAWGLVVVIAGYVIYKYRQASAATTATNLVPTTSDATGTGLEPSTNTSSTSGSAIQTLSDWENAVQSWATGFGYDAANTQNALQAYATGNCLTSSQFNILDSALAQFGAPPGAPSTGLVQCPPSTTPSGGSGGTSGGNGNQSTGIVNTLKSFVQNGISFVQGANPAEIQAAYNAGQTVYEQDMNGNLIPVSQGQTIPDVYSANGGIPLYIGTPTTESAVDSLGNAVIRAANPAEAIAASQAGQTLYYGVGTNSNGNGPANLVQTTVGAPQPQGVYKENGAAPIYIGVPTALESQAA